MDQRFSIVTLGTNNLDRAVKFWEAMGWNCTLRPQGGAIAFFQTGGLALAIYPYEKLAEDCGMANRGPGFGGFTMCYNTFSKDEVDDVLRRAIAAGGKLQKPAHEAFWGGYSGYFCDIDGHPWEVAWNPYFLLTQDGEMMLPD